MGREREKHGESAGKLKIVIERILEKVRKKWQSRGRELRSIMKRSGNIREEGKHCQRISGESRRNRKQSTKKRSEVSSWLFDLFTCIYPFYFFFYFIFILFISFLTRVRILICIISNEKSARKAHLKAAGSNASCTSSQPFRSYAFWRWKIVVLFFLLARNTPETSKILIWWLKFSIHHQYTHTHIHAHVCTTFARIAPPHLDIVGVARLPNDKRGARIAVARTSATHKTHVSYVTRTRIAGLSDRIPPRSNAYFRR